MTCIMNSMAKTLGLMLVLTVCHSQEDGAPGFNKLFRTNKMSFEDYPVYFDKPLPSWIKGTLVRNGPGQFESGNQYFLNAMDGFSKLSSWKFLGSSSSVLFSTKFVQSESYKVATKCQSIPPYLSLGPIIPPRSYYQRIKCLINNMDNMNANIYNFGGQENLVSIITDLWKLYQVNLTSLDTVNSLIPDIPNSNYGHLNAMSTAHPLPEYKKDTHLTFLVSPSLLPWGDNTLSLIRVKSVDHRETVAEWKVSEIPYMHSFAVTPNYAVMYGAPISVSVTDILRHGNVLDAMKWNPNKKSTIFIINLCNGKVTTMETEPKFILHHANAYEDSDGKIVFDAPVYSDSSVFEQLDLRLMKNATKRKLTSPDVVLTRHIVDMTTDSVKILTFKGAAEDKYNLSRLSMPTINELYRSKHYCFLYGVIYNVDGKDFANIALVKKDVCGLNRDKSLYIPNHYPSEAWFVPHPASNQEDDGYLMSVVFDGDKGQSYIALIDAASMTIINTAYMPPDMHVPFPFHGRFFQGKF